MGLVFDPKKVWREYERGVSYHTQMGLYDTVKQNENFFIGKQWEGVRAPDLDKPTFNILKRVISYFVAMIASDDVAAQVSSFGGEDEATTRLLRAVSGEFERILEYNRIRSKNRNCIRNAAVDGDACMYVWYDPVQAHGKFSSGEIVMEEVENTNVFFGNPQVDDVQRQPYILLSQRMPLEEAKKEAAAAGCEPGLIHADDDPHGIGNHQEHGKVTAVLRFWKEDGVVWFAKVCRGAVLRQPVCLQYKRYPIAWWSWDRVKNCYHGQSCITGLIPNQIFINKLYAMCMEHVKKMAFPKVAYDRTKLPGGWSNRVGEAIPVNGDPNIALAANIGGADMSEQVIALIERTISCTRDMMGASDAALGNIRPDNTSAIIAVQKSAQMPLELQRMDFYDFVEQYIRIFLEIMRVDYGLRQVRIADEEGKTKNHMIDFSKLDALALKLDVEVGASSYWSELAQVQTIDNLMRGGIITDPVVYLESIPDGYIKNKNKIVANLKEKEQVGKEGMEKEVSA